MRSLKEVIHIDQNSKVFRKLYEENERIKFESFESYVMCLGTTILYSSLMRASGIAELSNTFKKAINGSPLPPDRHVLSIILLRNMANQYATEVHVHDAIERHRGSFSIDQVRNILRKHNNHGIINKKKGIFNHITGKVDNRATHFVFSPRYIKDWVLWNMRSFGMDRNDLNDYSQGAWSTDEGDWLFKHIGWHVTDLELFDEDMRVFTRDLYNKYQ